MLSLILTACYFPTAEIEPVEGDSLLDVEVLTPTSTPFIPSEEMYIEHAEEKEPPRAQVLFEEEEVVERITRSLVEVTVDSETISKWYTENYWRELEIVDLRCGSECSVEEIEDLLGPVFMKDIWTAVQIGRVLYTHSGWDRTYGPEFGELFRRILRDNSSESYNLCLGTKCYVLVAYVSLGREEIGENWVISQIFGETKDTDIFILTCDGFVDTNILTPKLILQFTEINNTQ